MEIGKFVHLNGNTYQITYIRGVYYYRDIFTGNMVKIGGIVNEQHN